MSIPVVPAAETLGDLKPIATVVFSLGSNEGDSIEYLQAAVNALATTPDVIPVGLSSVYLTKPVGAVIDQPDFRNIVFVAETTLEPSILLDRCHAIEAGLGRVRTVVGGPRTMDVDLIMVGNRTVQSDELTLPHPRAHERAFVLIPWLEADPQAELPGHGFVADLIVALGTDGVELSEDEQVVLP